MKKQHRHLLFLLVILCSMNLFAANLQGEMLMKKEINDVEKKDIIDSLATLLTNHYIFPDIAEKMVTHIKGRLEDGDYNSLNTTQDFALEIDKDLFEISNDRHFRFVFDPMMADIIIKRKSKSEEEKEKAEEFMLEMDRAQNFGFKKIENLPGNIGYLDLEFFACPENGAETAVAAMNFLANSDAVIIDLRTNHGGHPEMVQFITSYFFPTPTHLNSFEIRGQEQIDQFWTLPYVPGKTLYEKDLYVLTSNATGSGAEEFSYNIKNLKRGTLIGQTTAGAAHPIDEKVINGAYIINLPYGRPINPISKTNWEVVGVVPDIEIEADKALDKAYYLAIEKLLENENDPMRKQNLSWALTGIKAKLEPVTVSETLLKQYAGSYGPRQISLKDGVLHYKRTDRNSREYVLKPLTQTIFALEGLDYFRLDFQANGDDEIEQVVGMYIDGHRDVSKRDK